MRNRNVNLSDFENDLQVNLRTDRARKWVFRAFRGKILKMYLLGTNHGRAFMDLVYVSVCSKKLGICHCSGLHLFRNHAEWRNFLKIVLWLMGRSIKTVNKEESFSKFSMIKLNPNLRVIRATVQKWQF